MGKTKKTKKSSSPCLPVTSLQTGNVLSQAPFKRKQATSILKKCKSVDKYPAFESQLNPVPGQEQTDPVVCNIDHSIAREPIDLGVRNVRQILMCLEEGTDEVKDLVMNECDIIYECKLCTGLFRSLANFIAHKRVYCKEHFCQKINKFDSATLDLDQLNNNDDGKDVTVEQIAFTSTVDVGVKEEVKDEDCDINLPQLDSMHSPSTSVSSSLDSRAVKATVKRKFIEECAERLKLERLKEQEAKNLNLSLMPISSNPNAVFQKLLVKSNLQPVNGCLDDSKDEQSDNSVEVEPRDNNHEPGLTEAKKPKVDGQELFEDSQEAEELLKCNICKSANFISSKTLKVHMQTIHASYRMVYPCPLCSFEFKQLSNATRHVIQIHKKNKTQANNLREVIKRRSYYSTNGSENTSEAEEEDSTEKNETTLSDESILQVPSVPVVSVSSETTIVPEIIPEKKEESQSFTLSTNSNERIVTVKSHHPRVVNSCAFKCGNRFKTIQARISHEKKCKLRFENAEVRLKPASPTKLRVAISSNSLLRDNKNADEVKTDQSQSVPIAKLETNPILKTSTRNIIYNPALARIAIPRRVEEEIDKFINKKLLRCRLCPKQIFRNLNLLIQHAVTHCGYHVFKCHGCCYHTIREMDMKNHLINNHNIGIDNVDKHYQTIANPIQSRDNHLPMKAKKSINGPTDWQSSNGVTEQEKGSMVGQSDQEKGKEGLSLKIHLRPMNTLDDNSKKCYKIVDK